MTLKLLTSAKDYFLELLFPVKCVVCEKETGAARKNKLICTECLKKLTPSLNFYCPLCEARSSGGEICFSCYTLSSGKPAFFIDRLLSPFSYKETGIQKIIKAFKYHYIKELEKPLAKIMERYLEKITGEIDLAGSLVIPVPLHKRKYFQRGYNQAQLLAEHISRSLNLEIAKDCLIKSKATRDQVKLKNEERTKNLKGVFVSPKPEIVSDRKILLIDDVYTTGATMAECAKVLKEAGVKEVIGLVIARG